jgi:molybdopterin-binding protein
MKLSARNQFKGMVVDIQERAVNGIVKIEIGAVMLFQLRYP